MGGPGIWLNIILGMSVRAFLGEITIGSVGSVKQTAFLGGVGVI